MAKEIINMDKLKNSTIGLIGAGNMGSAIVSGLIKILDPKKIYCYDIDNNKKKKIADSLGVNSADKINTIPELCNIVILAVKPDTITKVLLEIKSDITNQVIVSIAAGVTIQTMEKTLGSDKKIIRVMPNTPALIGEGMSALSPNSKVSTGEIQLVEEIFNMVGKAISVPEKLMDAVTAVSGCGPAYGFMLIQAMAEGGVKLGIPRDKAMLLAAQTIAGAAKLVLESNEEPIVLRGKVTSPGGSTIDAVHSLEKAGITGAIMDAIEIAAKKSEELGKYND